MLAMALSCRRGRITQGLALMYDMKNLSRISHLEANASKGMDAFWQFDRAAFEDGTVSALTKQLAAVAVALTTQCPYCIELHAKAAREAGATDAQLSEIALVAAAIRAGGAVTHATHLFPKTEG
ncbi:alkylhydroperoxidase [Gluconobacter cerinus NRIC 0229]|uniref:Alkyl hydroperoxide reductase AhpD n=2 Tax=Acetobacteraceae TaxID=433 RepID=A0A1B6VI68_9PROT|nr:MULTISPECIES: carboxymuconolactone decarboxylase family protein [Gluconobacter]GBR00881.1 alkylhydroperoxidase [Gluconobacter cerinus NRIC 0229]GFE96742.1 alkyl hydroperoxide reductase AhpD [Gluconobacter sp. Gdi]MCW2266165.1 AhpD family alkylhydroperoxidase [Gluconobacter cerinus]OAJ66925.1 alkylhydroperoxidase [Gluconobacter cerinus]GLQ63512.1 alkyl hydroperoxide reductase AhpD [Gluconobacter cerinus]